MLSNLNQKLRRHYVSEQEEYLIALGKFILNPSEYFVGIHHSQIRKFPIFEGSLKDKFQISDIYISIDSFRFGWIQNIEIYKSDNLAKVGHFALEKELAGLGIGKHLAKSFAQYLNTEYGVTKIHFIERSVQPVYKTFFENTLKAQYKEYMGNEAWLWEFGNSSLRRKSSEQP